MDTEFNLSQWKSSSLLPTFSICFVLILALIIFLSSQFNLLYMQKRGLRKEKARFKLTISFTTLYTISGTEFFIGGLIQGLIYLKGTNIFLNLKTCNVFFVFLGTSQSDIIYTYYNVTVGQLFMLFCFLLTDNQAKKYAKRKLDALMDSWLSKRENLNAKDLFSTRKTPYPYTVSQQFENDVFVIEMD